ncbi:MAG: hypothetical protein IJV14_18200, partial [Lachnospiraceae bacterium]|nr:hypothetical protein [Lachnospiraceae bacterium]
RRTGSSKKRKNGLNLNLDLSFLKKIPYISQIPPKILGGVIGGLLLILVVALLVNKINDSSAKKKEEAAAQAQQEEQQVEKTEEELQQEAIMNALQGISAYTLLQEGSFNESDYSIILPVKCEASSMLVGQSGKVYGTEFLFDRTVETSWQEGEADEGLGTTIYTEFPESTKIKAIGIWPGNQVSEEKFRANNRPTSLNFSAAYEDQTANTDVQLLDQLGEQLIVFDTAVPVDNLIMTIKGVSAGDTYNDTVISEMTFYTEKP